MCFELNTFETATNLEKYRFRLQTIQDSNEFGSLNMETSIKKSL